MKYVMQGDNLREGVTSFLNLATIYRNRGKYDEAEPMYRQALVIDQKILGPEHPFVTISLTSLAAVYEDQGKHVEADPLYRRSLKILNDKLGPNHPDTKKVQRNYNEMLKKQV